MRLPCGPVTAALLSAPNSIYLYPGSLSENPIWLRAACFATGRRPAASTIYSDIACFAVLASHKTARSRANDEVLRQTHRDCCKTNMKSQNRRYLYAL